MKCPYCSMQDTKVIDSRPAEDYSSIRRRRLCDKCNRRFTTYEKVDTIPLMIIKKDDTREAYNRLKIESGIVRSCHKRAVSSSQIKDLVDDIETTLYSLGEEEILASYVGELVLEKLKKVDEVAYVRFACVYRDFKSIDNFMEELKTLLKKK